jgi:Mitochondrial carrier protein
MAAVYNSQLDAFELHHIVQERSSTSSSLDGSALESLGHALSGSVGASLSNVITYPLDLIITRLQIQRQLRQSTTEAGKEYKSVEDAARRIYNEEGGIAGFYAGLLQDTVKTIADSFLFFLLYSFLRERQLRRVNGKGLSAIEELGVGFVAGSLTKAATTPMANVVTRKQAAVLLGGREADGASTGDIAQSIMDEKGLAGFWSGYSASLILTLNPSLTFAMFEGLKRLTVPRSKRDNPPAAMTFLLSATSKAMASAVTYPFSLAKSRLQAGDKKENSEDDKIVGKDVAVRATKEVVRDTIFSTLFAIIEQEGWQSLYEGLGLEVVKGFFSHGITMLVKQVMQRLLARLYYILSIVLGRYRRKLSANRLRQRAKENVEYYNLAMARASDKIEEGANALRSKANETAEFVAEYVEEENGEWRDLYGTVGLAKWLGGDRKGPG